MSLEDLLAVYRHFMVRIIVNDQVGQPMADMSGERVHAQLVAGEIRMKGGTVPEIVPTEDEIDHFSNLYAEMVVQNEKYAEELARKNGGN